VTPAVAAASTPAAVTASAAAAELAAPAPAAMELAALTFFMLTMKTRTGHVNLGRNGIIMVITRVWVSVWRAIEVVVIIGVGIVGVGIPTIIGPAAAAGQSHDYSHQDGISGHNFPLSLAAIRHFYWNRQNVATPAAAPGCRS
jgi:hypothetical protein